MVKKKENRKFKTETKQLLDLMVHSIYSHREIFLRELISNSSDALDRLRFEVTTKTKLAEFTKDPHIRIDADAEKRVLTVSDNGIGMNHDELVSFIGTIAKSGSKEYLQLLQEARKKNVPPELIGQFGVGFYSSFMVADKVTVITRRVGEAGAWKWESEGDGSYTIEEAERSEPGTSVTLQLKAADPEGGLPDFAVQWTIQEIVKKYSDFVAYPIRMKTESTKIERDKDGKPVEGAGPKTEITDEVLNSMKAIWTRSEKDVTDEEYNEFYKHISHDWNDPLLKTSYKAEGTSEFLVLLYVPSRAPFNMFAPGGTHGVQLYIKRIFIMQDCKDLIPEYLRFVSGVVDSEDLDLNISRELLQQNRYVQIIRKSVVKKLLDTLKQTLTNDREKYIKFWNEFGRALKEGIFHDVPNKEKLLDLCLFRSTMSDGEWTTLEDYVNRMKESQDTIYYMTGKSLKALEESPHLEAFREKGYEVLLLSDPVDEIWVQSVFECKGKKLQSIGKGEVELGTEDERKKEAEERKGKKESYKSFVECIKDKLSDHIKEVRLSSRLTSSPVCLVGDPSDMTPQMEQLFRGIGQDVPETKRILEMNPDHAIIVKLKGIFDKDKDEPILGEYAGLLYGHALLAEGGQLKNPAAFTKNLAQLMAKTLE